MFRKRFFVIFCFFLIFSPFIKCQDDDGEITPTSGAEANEIERNPREVFLELIRQRFNGNAVQQVHFIYFLFVTVSGIVNYF